MGKEEIEYFGLLVYILKKTYHSGEKVTEKYEIKIPKLKIVIRENTLRQAFVRLGNKLKRIKKKEYERLIK